jgi:hypothetical protein
LGFVFLGGQISLLFFFFFPFNACIAEDMTVSILEWASEGKNFTKCVRTFWASRMVSQGSI